MKHFLTLMIFAALLACSENDDATPSCSIPATVRDLSGLDGCGFVFELNDGTRLQPIIRYYLMCGTPPAPANPFAPAPEDPLYNFQFVDGKKVLIDYEIEEGASTCMVGPMVRITCISEPSFIVRAEN